MAAASDQAFAKLPIGGKIALLALIVGLFSAVYYFALHMSLADEIESAQQQHVALEGQLREAEARQREYIRLTQELAAREAVDREHKRILPERAEIAAFLEDINRLAELSGLDIRLVEPRPEEPAELFIRIPVQVQVAGRYHQVAKFFYNVSRLPRAINMENIKLVEMNEPRDAAEDEIVLAVETLATTFRRQVEEEGVQQQ
jgi:type IV pilus assembly protein PilO